MTDFKPDRDLRPSPEALLAAANRQEGKKGKLKIFVGAAPGVGKTYAMLEAAQAKRRAGVDVVVGLVETHGRAETQALLQGLEVLPRRAIAHGGHVLEEFDLDAALQRLPQIILVDELAHTNAPGCRHPKRYMDVEELLDAGVDVYSAVNIQHIESLNDVVAQITHVRVRETIPDSIFERADALELIDITPDDLIQRLRDGKVYVPQQAERALEHFFSPTNLTALRELALRRTAERVDQQLFAEMQARAISGPLAAGERILVAVSEDPRSLGLVRHAKRLADRLHASFVALTVESSRSARLNEAQRDRIAEALRLAVALGGDAVTLPGAGERIADDVIAYARSSNVTHIIIGKSSRSRWFEIFHGSVVHDLVRRSGNISVHVLSGDAATSPEPERPRPAQAQAPLDSRPYAVAFGAVTAALGLGLIVGDQFGIENVDLIFLTAIVLIAARYGLGPSLMASAVASLAYNFFFLPPVHTLTITDPTHVIAFILFTVMAAIVSNVAARVRAQALTAANRARITESLYAFSRKLAGVGTLDDVLWATAYQAASLLKVRVVILLPENGGIAVKAGYPPEDELDKADLAAATWAWENNRAAGRGADTLPGAKRLFLPMQTNRGAIGVVGIDSDKAGPILTPDESRLLDALIDQSALAIERVHLVEDADRVKRALEADRLRTALLTSISHDLKTPLAAILGSASALRDFRSKFSDAETDELLATVVEESERLNRFIANLLDMTRLESGALAVKTSPMDVSDCVGGALRRAAKILARHRVEADLQPGLPMIEVDAVLLEQALFNLLDNAAKYAPDGSLIRIQCRRDADRVSIQVLDEGEGINPGETEKIFDKFYRAQKGDHVRAGTGLGLAIARGFVEALHGTLTAANRGDRNGAALTIRLPAREQNVGVKE